MNRLLVEIGTEEIPAGYIQPALVSFSAVLTKKLADARIIHGAVQTFGTPRRLALMIAAVADRQSPLSEEILGPPERVGLDPNGEFTVAARKFAEKNQISVDLLKIKETEKGRYLYAVKTEAGLPAKTILRRILPEAILAVAFPKTMRWADLKIHFARPIHNICALLGGQVISFSVGNIRSGRTTFGHRFLSPKKIKLSAPEDYPKTLKNALVLADISERRDLLLSRMNAAVAEIGGRVIPDAELVETVVGLVEYPFPVVGRFDEVFLSLPREILITSMREHQKYFAVVDGKNALKPCFVAINNTKARDMALVAKGHERVLRARLSDAQFFFNADLKTSLDEKKEKLASVLFQADLGSMMDKTARVGNLAVFLAGALNIDAETTVRIGRAADLCKADLVSQVVVEFPKLQGVMGRVYALAQGEAPGVAAAIAEHYWPAYAGGDLPQTLEGAVLSIADKADSICGCFSADLIPTGASDPYALRRQANGIILIALEKGFPFSLTALIAESLKIYGRTGGETAGRLAGKILEFLKGRMASLLEADGISKDAVAAVLSTDSDVIPMIWKKAKGLEALKSAPDFEIIATAFKRVVNIIRKADAADTKGIDVKESLFEHPSEGDLYRRFLEVNRTVADHLENGRMDKAFATIATLREVLNRFFDDVMVMAENPEIRKNRLALLGRIAGLFAKLADFSKIST